MKKEENAYVLGTDRAELNRLGVQHQVWASEAQHGWRNAGFTRGMTIMDLGSGPGFCSKELGYLVGEEGKVLAVDKSTEYLQYLDELAKLHALNIKTINKDFSELEIEADSLDGMYSRWALAWVPQPEEVLAKVYKGLRRGGKMVIHEYYHWLTHQINPSGPNLKKAVKGCYDSFQDTGGNIDIGKELPSMLSELGMKVVSTRSMSKFATPADLAWQWPRSFYEVYWPKIQEMGYLSMEELAVAFEELEIAEKTPGVTLLCPLLVEIVAEKM